MTDWQHVPHVFIPAPRCPKCESLARLVIKSLPVEDDHSRTRRCVCQVCSLRFVEVIDPDVAIEWQDGVISAVDSEET
tara:strand:- start:54687 stop:54920 length:234 start_codon:yes stop_codon:yes gene_type:complete